MLSELRSRLLQSGASLILVFACACGCRSGSSPSAALGLNRLPPQSEPPVKTVDEEVDLAGSAEPESSEPTSRNVSASSSGGNVFKQLLKPARGGKRKRFPIPRTDLDSESQDDEELASKDEW